MAEAFGFTVPWTVSYYVMLTYLPTFTQRYAGLSPTGALWANTAGLPALVVAIPAMGALPDRVGRRPLLSGLPAAGVALVQVGYSLAVAVFGGFAPFIATWLIRATGTPVAPTFRLIAAGVVSAATIATFRETAFERLR